MVAGFVAHTVWIGTICAATGHPPITNLPETLSFVAWVVFGVELALWVRYRVKRLVEDSGAQVLQFPTIAPPLSYDSLDRAVDNHYDWLIFTSTNGVAPTSTASSPGQRRTRPGPNENRRRRPIHCRRLAHPRRCA